MPTFEPWDIIRVPFPYTDRPVREHRPTPVVATFEAKEAEFKGRLPSNERLAVSHHVLRFMSGMADEQ